MCHGALGGPPFSEIFVRDSTVHNFLPLRSSRQLHIVLSETPPPLPSPSGDMLQSVFGHRHIVSCVDFSPKEGCHAHFGAGLISTGSHDTTVLLWRWSGRLNRVVGSLAQSQSKLSESFSSGWSTVRLLFLPMSFMSVSSVSVVSPVSIAGLLTPLSVCTGHRKPVGCVSVSASLGILASGAKREFILLCNVQLKMKLFIMHYVDDSTLIHSISGELLHNISPGGGPSGGLSYPHLLQMTRSGHLVVHYADQKGVLAVFTSNGKLLSRLALDGPALVCMLYRIAVL